jgi:hypothetical protein|tara:strand:+ start:286 stop:480 length:195 start_codon:yes stop_codon:yes gene_type:complete
MINKTYAERIASDEHIERVCKLTISDLFELADNDFISHDIVNDIYYKLLDLKSIRKHLEVNNNE